MKFLPKSNTLRISLLFLLILIALYNLKSPIFRLILSRKVAWAQEKYPIKISYSNAKVKGLKTIEIIDLRIANPLDSTLIFLSQAKAVIDLRSLASFKVKPVQLSVDSMWINLNPLISYLDKKDKESSKVIIDSSAISTRRSKILSKINSKSLQRVLRGSLLLASTNVDVNSFNCSYISDSYFLNVSTQKFSSESGNFTSTFEINDNHLVSYVLFNGFSDIDIKSHSFSLTGNNESIKFPLVNKLFGLSSQIDSLGFTLQRNFITKDSINISVESCIQNLKLNHPQISSKDVNIDMSKLKLDIGVTETCIHFESTSFFTVNSFTLPFSFSLNTAKPRLKLDITDQEINMQSLFESLPTGLFSTFKGIKVNGNAMLNLSADISFANLDSLKFFVNLKPQNFKIISYGNINFSMLQDTFTHYTFRNDSLSNRIKLDNRNPKFRKFDKISPYIIHAVVAAEDGGFYHHKGFDLEGFNYALIRNLKDKRLGRGGSTITMQLVKNIYLNRNKTLTRKGEEALIVWLIETQRLIEKERILEIYLNIIEWGPDIYGITEASDFYFDKDPANLTLNEAIFMASIIPRPKQFMHYFDKQGNLRDFMDRYFAFVGKTLKDRGLITDSEYENLTPYVTITGRASTLLKYQNEYENLDDIENEETINVE